MENFIVSARKYRPQTFDTVVGQKAITNTLKNAIKNQQLAQAFLFCGPRGVGKTTCARILAKTINCQNLTPEFEACDQCTSCQSFNQTASFNLHELDAASNNSVDDIRNLVDQVRIPPQAGKYKVYIIDEVHMLSSQAFNAFLKTLEEPPAYAKFILATTEKHKIIPTILSRCQIFDFRRITVDDIAQHLKFVAEKENITASPDALHIIAQKADGALRDALSIFDQIASSTEGNITYQAVIENMNILDYEFYFTMVNHTSKGNISETLLLIDQVIDNGFDGLLFIDGFSAHLRNLLICKDERTADLIEVSETVKERYKEQVRFVSTDYLLRSLEIANQCGLGYKTSNNKRLQLELGFMQICRLTAPTAPEAQPPQAEPEKKKPEPTAEALIKKETEDAVTTPPVQTREIPKDNEKASLQKSSLFSLKDLGKTPARSGENTPLSTELQFGEDTFTEAGFQAAWMNFAASVQEKQPNFFATLTARMPEISEGVKILLKVDNLVQEDEVNRRRGEILSFLRKQLNNRNIEMEVNVTTDPGEKRHISPEERYKKMAEKNPAITRLKNQLDLEIDY